MTDKREKRCIDCKRVKPLSEYYRNHTGRDGRRTRCKSCYSVIGRKRRIAKGSNGKGHGGIRGAKGTKVCSKCGHPPQPLSAFYRSRTGKDGRRGECKACSGVGEKKRRNKRGQKSAHYRPIRDCHPIAITATCLSELGKDRYYTGRKIKGFYESIRVGSLPPGSVWMVHHQIPKKMVVWGRWADQYAKEIR